ncbi:SMC family protein [Yeosuana marina]|uniref:hypothetical protein n=1 Tax=Yeosuana marina TaxID=1565536 RepID=UPI00142127FB|nr:hypothetical protein [Yeosuana marina]
MSNLLIKQVKYIGNDYIYESPILSSGINILEGENGSGKTTFSSLIYFGFGGNVKWFKEDKNDDHQQIIKDNSNYVELTFLISDISYTVTRYFYSYDIHIISQNEVKTLPINRSPKKDFTFSDWILNKLNIKVVDIYQGSEYYKINFYDLARLFYYDQTTSPDRIYKRPDNENYVSDSSIIKKAIFEILTGNSFGDYYQAIADYRKVLEEKATIKALIQNFESLNISESLEFEGKNSYNLNKDLNELSSQLRRLEDYRESINSNENSTKSNTEIISSKRREYSNYEEKLIDLKKAKASILLDYRKVKRLKSDLILEVTHMTKIIIANEKLNLFSPDTCPYCLQKSVREENKCICGNTVTDEQYQKFFYTKEEYFNILKSKQKNIETIDNALDSYKNEILKKNDLIAQLDYKLNDLKSQINYLVKGRRIVKNLELKEVNDKVFSIEKSISNLRQQIKIEQKREQLEKDKTSIDQRVEARKRDMELLKLEASKNMDDIIISFNKKYYSLMEKALFDCTSARISPDDYMPIINSGSYKEASSNVSKRLMYFYTLLHLSLTLDIKFPSFLLIDTPENIGIDDADLINAISLIDEIGNNKSSMNESQIILTTGLQKYPEKFKNKVFDRITKQNKLLKRRVFDIGS